MAAYPFRQGSQTDLIHEQLGDIHRKNGIQSDNPVYFPYCHDPWKRSRR